MRLVAAARLDPARPADQQRGPRTVEPCVALGKRHGDSVVRNEHDQCVLCLARLIQCLHHPAKRVVQSSRRILVLGQFLPHTGQVGQETGDLDLFGPVDPAGHGRTPSEFLRVAVGAMRVVRIHHEVKRLALGLAPLEEGHTPLVVDLGVSAISQVLAVERVVPLHGRGRSGMADLAEDACQVTGPLEGGHDVRRARAGFHETHGTRVVTQQAGGNHGPAGCTDRDVHMPPLEQHALGGESVEVRSQIADLAAIDAQ